MTKGFNQAAIDNQQPDGGMVVCPNCRGRARMTYAGKHYRCMICNGEGYITADELRDLNERANNQD